MHRRDLLKKGAALASAVVLPSAVDLEASAATAGSTLVIAAPATPQSLDCNFDGSLGTIDVIAALYDNLLDFKQISDPRLPSVLREDIADYPNMPAGLNVEGKLAQSFELDPASKFIRFQLRQGVKSNWGNELTADDIKWTWDRKFGLSAIGAFYLLRMTHRVLDVLVSHPGLDQCNCSIFSGWRQGRFSCCSRTVRPADCS